MLGACLHGLESAIGPRYRLRRMSLSVNKYIAPALLSMAEYDNYSLRFIPAEKIPWEEIPYIGTARPDIT
jgi:hypothetical protein